MREIIEWLRQVEELAHGVYQDGAERFAGDPGMSSFLGKLAEDEALHYHLLGSAAVLLEKEGAFPVPAVKVDDETRDRVAGPLRDCALALQSESATEERILKGLYEAERSEWNDIFLYVVGTCQPYSRMFQQIASIMHAHGQAIEEWFDHLPPEARARVGKRELPQVWKHRFLVVEDNPALRELFRRVLSTEGDVYTAANGEEGLKLARETFFDVILSDHDMPVMTGAELYRLGLELDPEFGQHFILCTGNISSEVRLFCRSHGLMLLEKPVSVGGLRRAVLDVLHGRRREGGQAVGGS